MYNDFSSFFSETAQVFVKELKRALIKDIQKRMCESYAFYLYEQWWTEQDKKYKDKVDWGSKNGVFHLFCLYFSKKNEIF